MLPSLASLETWILRVGEGVGVGMDGDGERGGLWKMWFVEDVVGRMGYDEGGWMFKEGMLK